MTYCCNTQTKSGAKTSCGTINLCAGLECGIEGSLHAVREVWPEADGWERDGGIPEDATVPSDEEWEMLEATREDRAMQIFNPPDPRAAESESQRSRYKPETGFGSMAVDAYNGFGEIKRYCFIMSGTSGSMQADLFLIAIATSTSTFVGMSQESSPTLFLVKMVSFKEMALR